MQRCVAVLVLILLLSTISRAQPCSNLGQTPETAFPVCGTSTFTQTNVPICGSAAVTVPGCTSDAGYSDKNPYWYRIDCFESGTLDFVITPNDLGDDYDWMLYDITGQNPREVFYNRNLVVTGNWAGTYGLTGASPGGSSTIQCASIPSENRPTFARSPSLIKGHTYLLLVSHYTDSQSGYKLSFSGGTAVITDNKLPALENALAACQGSIIRVKLNKKMKCNSLAANGSDFLLKPSAGNVVKAVGVGCTTGFDMDSVILTVDRMIAPGNYNLVMTKGSDGNSLLDNCDRQIDSGAALPVTVYPVFPTPMDSVTSLGCAPDVIHLVFNNNIRCSSIAPDGSDFIINGLPVSIVGAVGTCVDGLTSVIHLRFAAPLQKAGRWTVQLKRGTDGNTIIDECGMETPIGESVYFVSYDTVNADFSHAIRWGCVKDTVDFFHPGGNDVKIWIWRFGGTSISQEQNPTFIFPSFGDKPVTLQVSNGVCADTVTKVVVLDNAMDARFGAPDILCPDDPAKFIDSSMGKIINWHWTFGNGTISTQQLPDMQRYARPAPRSVNYTIRLIVENDKNCFDTAYRKMEVVPSCYITVPNAFTPNGDGNNDELYPLNAFKATDLQFRVYNRFGQLVFETKNWRVRWDGKINGQLQASGAYVWVLTFTHIDTKEKITQKGTTMLIR
ncbi:gliding motility-associated C-terminal domain-containing protein [Paraflavitalea pollutisoli]|uniref:T9SS type B sorting domain-containing protein n=1 Tax=Paraflavitalea pollutisoli TaxID=3034143 RepID=UPI0023EC14A4|nr:gliding motility-associated C-terminal domain-containing protein [Paraflavitalea sp. H1-2-19X]